MKTSKQFKKEETIRKVRKEVKLPKNFGKMKSKDSSHLMHNIIAQEAAIDYLRNKTAQKIEVTIEQKNNPSITIILVTLAILVVIAIYISIK